MATLFVKHKVNNYENWKRVYDEFASKRKEWGVTEANVYHTPDDPNTIIVTHDFKNMDTAQKFANSEELKSAMENAGVSSPPEIWFGDEIESKPF